jgi:UDP-2-acetamido-3-amino-2,3-dideoxy-glucuronate N-acetyltransferase
MRTVNERTIGIKTIIYSPKNTNLYGCVIGEDCRIGAFVEIGNGVVIGDRASIQAFTFIPGGVKIGNDVFIGPRVTFLNDKYPPSNGDWMDGPQTIVEDGAVIGGCSVIMPGITIGSGAFIGAASLVTKNIGKGEKWWGSPATIRT